MQTKLFTFKTKLDMVINPRKVTYLPQFLWKHSEFRTNDQNSDSLYQ
jgi:hypothetical protein